MSIANARPNNRLTARDFSGGRIIKVVGQFGELFIDDYGTEYVWAPPKTVELKWSTKCNLENQPGIVPIGSGHGFSGYESGIYHRYQFPEEHCFRIVEFVDD